MTHPIVFLLSLAVPTAIAGYAGSSSGNFVGSGGTSGGYGYGYSGGIPPGFPQQIFQQIPFDFNSLLAGYLEAFQKHHQTLMSNTTAYAYTSISLDPLFEGTVHARSRVTFDGLNQIQNQVQNAANGGYGSPGGYPAYFGAGAGAGAGSYAEHGDSGSFLKSGTAGGYVPSGGATGGYVGSGGYGGAGGYGGGAGGYGGSGGYAPAGGQGGYAHTNGRGGFVPSGGYGAGASASIGGGQVQQSAFLNPENPVSPNVNVRFGETGPQGGGGSYSVFSSSSSGSRNIDGKPVNFRHASTTVNDNGKVTTYTVRD